MTTKVLDTVYFQPKGINKNLMLHSYQIKFIIDDIKHTYTALLPDYFRKLLKIKISTININ